MKPIPFFSLATFHDKIRNELHKAFTECLDSSNFILGPQLKAFEQEFAEFQGSKYCLGVGNGLDALSISLRVLGMRKGDEVIVPSHTFVATALAVSSTGATPVFVEPSIETYNLDPSKIQEKISSQTRAIIAVHLYGLPADMNAITSIAQKNSLFVVEDNAQAHGATYFSKTVGSLGNLGCTSFYPTKNLGALGDGGAITTNDAELYEKCLRLRNYGSRVKYEHEELGVNSRLDELQAAFLQVKLRYFPSSILERQRIAKIYSENLKDIKGIQLPWVPQESTHVYHLYVIQAENRNALREFLAKNGVETLIHYPKPVPLQSCFKFLKPDSADYPVSIQLSQSVLSLPLFPGLSEDQIVRVAGLIRSFYSTYA